MLSTMSNRKQYVLDSSAIVAIILQEPDSHYLASFLTPDTNVSVGTPTLVEAAMVLISRLAPGKGLPALLSFVQQTNCETISFTGAHFAEAAIAFERFGKGRHPASLNIGDCNSYATAKLAGATLLYKEDGFAKTDLPPLTPPAS